jgi:hypothetical protein
MRKSLLICVFILLFLAASFATFTETKPTVRDITPPQLIAETYRCQYNPNAERIELCDAEQLGYRILSDVDGMLTPGIPDGEVTYMVAEPMTQPILEDTLRMGKEMGFFENIGAVYESEQPGAIVGNQLIFPESHSPNFGCGIVRVIYTKRQMKGTPHRAVHMQLQWEPAYWCEEDSPHYFIKLMNYDETLRQQELGTEHYAIHESGVERFARGLIDAEVNMGDILGWSFYKNTLEHSINSRLSDKSGGHKTLVLYNECARYYCAVEIEDWLEDVLDESDGGLLGYYTISDRGNGKIDVFLGLAYEEEPFDLDVKRKAFLRCMADYWINGEDVFLDDRIGNEKRVFTDFSQECATFLDNYVPPEEEPKLRELRSGNAFLVSDEDWKAVLSLVPVAIYTDEDGNVHKSPILVYRKQGPVDELDLTEVYDLNADERQIYPKMDTYVYSSADISKIEYDTEFNRICNFDEHQFIGLVDVEDARFVPDAVRAGERTEFRLTIRNCWNADVIIDKIKRYNDFKPYLVSKKSPSSIPGLELEPGETVTLIYIHEFEEEIPESFDVDSVIHFLQQYRPETLTMVGEMPEELQSLLFTKSPLGIFDAIGEDEIEVQTIQPPDYLSYWNGEIDTLVFADDGDYEGALMAAVYASYIHAPLLFLQDGHVPNEYYNLITGREIHIIAERDVHIPLTRELEHLGSLRTEFHTPESLRGEYIQLTGTNKAIMVNPADIDGVGAFMGGIRMDKKEDKLVTDHYSKTSLIAPILAAAKHEVIIPVHSAEYEKADEQFTESFIDLFNTEIENLPEYECSPGSPFCFPDTYSFSGSTKYSRGSATFLFPEKHMFYEEERDEGLHGGIHFWGKFVCDQGKERKDLNTPRIYINGQEIPRPYVWFTEDSPGSMCYPRSEMADMSAGFISEYKIYFLDKYLPTDEDITLKIDFEDQDVLIVPSAIKLEYQTGESGNMEPDLQPFALCNTFEKMTPPGCWRGYHTEAFSTTHTPPDDTALFNVENPGRTHVLFMDVASSFNVEEVKWNDRSMLLDKPIWKNFAFNTRAIVIPGKYVEESNVLSFSYDEDDKGKNLWLRNIRLVEAPLLEDTHYLTIMASPMAIQMSKPGMLDPSDCQRLYDEVDNYAYGTLGEGRVDLATGRIFGLTTSDVSSYVARSVFFDELHDSNKRRALVMFRGHKETETMPEILEDFEEAAWYKEKIWEDFNDGYYICHTYEKCSGENPRILEEYVEDEFILYIDHGSTQGIVVLKSSHLEDGKETLDLPVIVISACSTCNFVKEKRESLFCMQNLRRGSLASIDAVSSSYSTSFDKLLSGVYLEEKTIGEGLRDWKNSRRGGIHATGESQNILLGDPTVKPRWWS